MERLVTVRRCDSLAEFDQARVALEASGIPVMADAEATASVTHFGARAIGGLRIRVHASDAERAAEILAERHPPADEAEYARRARGAKRAAILAAAIGLATAVLLTFLTRSIHYSLTIGLLVAFTGFLTLTPSPKK